MSQINTPTPKIWYPPEFPGTGRLPANVEMYGRNCRQQNNQETGYHDKLCLAANRRAEMPCCKTVHISLFFDGTGNNMNYDLNIAKPRHPTNIARLFRATIG